jgi:hypothetical protein
MARRSSTYASDDQPLYIVKRDLSGGQNTRQFEQLIGDTQAVLLQNILLETAGSRQLRAGQTRIDNSYPAVSGTGLGLFGFDPDGGQFELLALQKTNLSGWILSGSFSNYKTDFTTGLLTTILKVGMTGQNDVAMISNGTDNVFIMYQDHTMHDLGDTNTSPPKTTALAYYANRVWALKGNLAYFSDAFPSNYATAFDRTTNAFRVPVGTARAIVATRDQGLIFLGADQIWQLAPSTVPSATTDFPQKVLDIGCVAGNTAVQVADDILFLAPDGVRGLFRTQLDKLQTGQSFPISFVLQDEFDAINWNHIDLACAVYFENKYIISLPTDGSAYNNTCWVYYSAYKAWVVYSGWNIARFAKIRLFGKEVLYGIDSVTGRVYQLFSGLTDNGSAIVFDEKSRAEDFGQPLVNKFGCEYKIKVQGGSGTLTISAAPDSSDWIQLGTVDTGLTTVTFPVTFPVAFGDSNETNAVFHLDDAGIIKFKRCKFRIYCDSPSAILNIIETSIMAFQEPYLSED